MQLYNQFHGVCFGFIQPAQVARWSPSLAENCSFVVHERILNDDSSRRVCCSIVSHVFRAFHCGEIVQEINPLIRRGNVTFHL